MTNICFDRTDGTILFALRLLLKHGRQRFQFDRISQLCARSMHFYITNAFWINMILLIDFLLQVDLTLYARSRDPIGFPVLIHSRSNDDPVDLIMIGFRIG